MIHRHIDSNCLQLSCYALRQSGGVRGGGVNLTSSSMRAEYVWLPWEYENFMSNLSSRGPGEVVSFVGRQQQSSIRDESWSNGGLRTSVSSGSDYFFSAGFGILNSEEINFLLCNSHTPDGRCQWLNLRFCQQTAPCCSPCAAASH